MTNRLKLSRRSFTKVIGAGAAIAALRPMDELKASWTTVLPGSNAGDPQPKVVRLSSNENPYGPSPASLKAMTDSFNLAWRYPDEYADMLSEELAKLHGVPVEQLLLGDGSGEVLKLCATAFTSKDKKLVMANPTFEAIGRHAATVDQHQRRVDAEAAKRDGRGARGKAVGERRRYGSLAVGGDASQHFLDRLLARLLDVLARDHLHRRGGLGIGSLDVRTRDRDAFELLSLLCRGGAQNPKGHHQPRAELCLLEH